MLHGILVRYNLDGLRMINDTYVLSLFYRWASLEQSERCTHMAGLQFALRREAERRVNIAAASEKKDIKTSSLLTGIVNSSGANRGPLVQNVK